MAEDREIRYKIGEIDGDCERKTVRQCENNRGGRRSPEEFLGKS